jgi:hypothetical protein
MMTSPPASNVQRIYEDVIATLSASERLRLVEMINGGLTEQPASARGVTEAPAVVLPDLPGWQAADRRSNPEWRDRLL